MTDIYIYTHRESLVRNHEPCAKALGNNCERSEPHVRVGWRNSLIASFASYMYELAGAFLWYIDPLHVTSQY